MSDVVWQGKIGREQGDAEVRVQSVQAELVVQTRLGERDGWMTATGDLAVSTLSSALAVRADEDRAAETSLRDAISCMPYGGALTIDRILTRHPIEGVPMRLAHVATYLEALRGRLGRVAEESISRDEELRTLRAKLALFEELLTPMVVRTIGDAIEARLVVERAALVAEVKEDVLAELRAEMTQLQIHNVP